MKKIWVYLLGVLTGIILTFLLSAIIVTVKGNSDPAYMSGLTLFEEPGDVMNDSGYEVLQDLVNGTALANSKDDIVMTVLLWNQEGNSYYDNQKVTLGEGQCFRQIGIYKYKSQGMGDRTVPVVTIMDE